MTATIFPEPALILYLLVPATTYAPSAVPLLTASVHSYSVCHFVLTVIAIHPCPITGGGTIDLARELIYIRLGAWLDLLGKRFQSPDRSLGMPDDEHVRTLVDTLYFFQLGTAWLS
jgi:hypothetical protein